MTTLDAALFVEAVRKSEVGWLRVADAREQPVWWVWHDDALVMVTGGQEQPDPGLVDGGTVVVIARSKDKGARLVSATCRVASLPTGSDDYQAMATALHGKRLNSPDGGAAVDRWRRESVLWRLSPDGDVVEAPGAMSADSHRREPTPTSATTRGKAPLVIGRRARRR